MKPLFVLTVAQFAASAAGAQANSEATQQRVINGTAARIEQFPSMVAITQEADNGSAFFCGGTIIDPHWVLTASHCVVSHATGKPAAPSSFDLVEGADDLTSGGHALFVDRVVSHPQYDRETLSNDIALLHLSQPAQVQPQLLASRAIRETVTRPGMNATVVGWGDTVDHKSASMPARSGRQLSAQLLQASMPIVSLSQCRQSYPSTAEGDRVRDNNICAGREDGGVSACRGDSGGPLFTQHRTLGNIEVGIASWVPRGCARAGQYAVYTSVGDFEAFIREFVPNASLAAEAGTATGQSHDGALSDAQPSQMPPPGETAQVTVDVLPTGPIQLGTPVTVRVSSSDAGVLMLFTRDADGHVTQLFPNRYAAPNPSALAAGREIRAGATMTVPGPTDRFRIRAQPPAGDTAVIAIVAPPEAKVLDLIERHQNLEVIENWDGFVAQLAERLRTASLVKATQAANASSGRALGVEQARPAIAIAERHFNVLQ